MTEPTDLTGRPLRIGIISADPELGERAGEAGGEEVPLSVPEFYGEWGVALTREWISDRLEVELSLSGLDALLFDAESPEELAGIIVAAVRLDFPVVCATPPETPFAAAVAALGLSPLGEEDAVETVVKLAADGRADAKSLTDNFALANALRVGLAVGGGPEVMVHLAAIAKEAGVVGFDQMLRVLASETPATTSVYSEWFANHGLPGVLHLLSEDLHDTRTVDRSLKSYARPAEESPPENEKRRISFIKGRSSGAEAVCFAPEGVSEVEGECRVFDSEVEAVEAVFGESGVENSILVVRGCGPRGGAGLWRLDELALGIEESGAEGVTVFTDGLASEETPGIWISLFSPEAASRGIIGRLQDGDFLKFDLEEGRILTSVGSRDFAKRKTFKQKSSDSAAYAARYAKSARPALEGAGFR